MKVRHRRPITSVLWVGHRSAIRAQLSACSQWVMAEVAMGFVNPHMAEVGLTSELLISTSTVDADPGVNSSATHIVGTHTRREAALQNCMSLTDSPWGRVCSSSYLSRSAPPPSHPGLEPDLGRSSLTTGNQSPHMHDRTVTTTEQRGDPSQH